MILIVSAATRLSELGLNVNHPGIEKYPGLSCTAAASAFLPHALLALAAEPLCEERDISKVLAAYFPWVSLVITMLDSYADQLDDVANGDHSYISHYADSDTAVQRLCEVVDLTARKTRDLHNGHRHATLVACMVAMHLSRDSACTPELRAGTRAMANAGGSLTRLLLPLLRIWRGAYIQRASVGRPQTRSASQSALPPGLPLPRAAQTFVIWKSPFTYLENSRCRYGSRFTMNMTSHPPLVFLSDVDDIKAMLTTSAEVLHPGKGSAMIEPLVGEESFMLREEEEHLNGRKTILPPFHAKVVHKHVDLVSTISRREIFIMAAGGSLRAASAPARADARDGPADDCGGIGRSCGRASLCPARSSAEDAGGDRQRGLSGAPAASRSREADLEALPARAGRGRRADLCDHRGSAP